jgi:hypothetical protein
MFVCVFIIRNLNVEFCQAECKNKDSIFRDTETSVRQSANIGIHDYT